MEDGSDELHGLSDRAFGEAHGFECDFELVEFERVVVSPRHTGDTSWTTLPRELASETMRSTDARSVSPKVPELIAIPNIEMPAFLVVDTPDEVVKDVEVPLSTGMGT